MTADDKDAGELGSSIQKALQLLEVFSSGERKIGLSAAARSAGMPKSTVYRLLENLCSAGLLRKQDGGYELTLKVFELASKTAVGRPDGIRQLALPYLSELHASSGRSVSLAVLSGTDVVILEKINRPRVPALPPPVGGRIPASSTALGKVILAFSPPEAVTALLSTTLLAVTRHSVTMPGVFISQLTRIREHGVGYETEEAALGIASAAAPVLHQGHAVAAIAVTDRADRLDKRGIDGMLRRAAASTTSDFAFLSNRSVRTSASHHG